MPPSSNPEPHASPADLARCRAMLRAGSKSFTAAARVLPRRVQGPATILYAFCRHADDEIDLRGGHDAALRLHGRIEDIYAGRPGPHAVDRALADLVRRHPIPRIALDALIEGFEWDLAERRYGTLDDVIDYSVRVAGTVGLMMAVLMGVNDRQLLARACDLGIAMQLTNIARDVGEDAHNGRLYLPRDWLEEAGVDPDAWLRRPVMNDALAAVIARLLSVADGYYARAQSGIEALPSDCRPGTRAARLIYAAIGDMIRANGYDSASRRAYVPARRKLALLLRSRRQLGRSAVAADIVPQAAFLLREPISVADQEGAGRSVDGDLAVLFGIIAKLNARDRERNYEAGIST